jgi:hypothetical protein
MQCRGRMECMKSSGLLLLVLSGVLFGCTRSQGSVQKADDLNGIWVGDFGPAFYDRNTISLELHWDGKNLTGAVRPGVPGGRMYRNFAGFPIENASFDPQTGELRFDATYRPKNRHYVIQGKLKGNTLSGSWNRPEETYKDGDFKLTKHKE